jgi:hypothetical protein
MAQRKEETTYHKGYPLGPKVSCLGQRTENN